MADAPEEFGVTEEMLDRALADSFPASDPIAYAIPYEPPGQPALGTEGRPGPAA
ncbi:MAG: hypothetical protein ACRDJO_12455 [Actinomycetota bacterium]